MNIVILLFTLIIIDLVNSDNSKVKLIKGNRIKQRQKILGIDNFGDFDATKYPDQYIKQKLDHFDPNSKERWSQRYWINSDFFDGSGPVFLILGEETTESASEFNYYFYNPPKLAKKHKALLLLLEMRYYGKSQPTEDLSNENLAYLNYEQIIADAAHFIKYIYSKYKLSKSQKCIAFGTSLSASIAAILRLKYPDVIYGAYAVSAPFLPIINLPDYFETVGDVIKKISPSCYTDLKHATGKLDKLVESKNYEKIAYILNSCDTPQSKVDVQNLLYLSGVPNAFATKTQYFKDYTKLNQLIDENSFFINKHKKNYSSIKNNISLGKVWNIRLQMTENQGIIESYCNIMTDKTIGDVLDRYRALNDFINGGSGSDFCINSSYSNAIAYFNDRSWNSPASLSSDIQYNYHQCSQLLTFSTTDSSNQPFGNFAPLDFQLKLCYDWFDNFDISYQKRYLKKYTKDFGGFNFEGGSRVLFTNEGFDPWHRGGFYQKPPNNNTDSIFVQGTAHCKIFFSNEAYPNEPTQLTEARNKANSIIARWINE